MNIAIDDITQPSIRIPSRQRPVSDRFASEAAVTCITRADIPVVAAFAAQRAHDDPAATWLLPDAGRRDTVLRGCFALLIEQALRHGFVDRLADDRAVAIWLDQTGPLPATASQARDLQQMCGDDSEAALLLLDVVIRHRPPIPHLHLAVLATDDPAAAAALLAYRQQRLDRIGVAAFAYASTQMHLAVLMDAGFEPGEAVRLPAGPPLWPALRPAARIAAAALGRLAAA